MDGIAAASRITEQWCRVLFKLDDKHYGVKSADDENADALELAFRL